MSDLFFTFVLQEDAVLMDDKTCNSLPEDNSNVTTHRVAKIAWKEIKNKIKTTADIFPMAAKHMEKDDYGEG